MKQLYDKIKIPPVVKWILFASVLLFIFWDPFTWLQKIIENVSFASLKDFLLTWTNKDELTLCKQIAEICNNGKIVEGLISLKHIMDISLFV
jgi:hypothetical protein